MGRENVLTFGKITLVSSGENVEKLMEYLDRIIQKHGYPDQVDHGIDEELDEVEEELAPEEESEDEEEDEGVAPKYPFRQE